MSSAKGDTKNVNIPRHRTESTASTDSDVTGTSVPERRFSLSKMLGRRTSVEDAYKKYAQFTTNGG
ncbi:unnamed protein product [Anisakis simplex]|uniref:Uncharacterized protein n=1 Tax=Anisakis simplex TaxID=6269 RepID=A0A0M3J428_ANISI|nr:unnamed protein product [Anisakis simplex]